MSSQLNQGRLDCELVGATAAYPPYRLAGGLVGGGAGDRAVTAGGPTVIFRFKQALKIHSLVHSFCSAQRACLLACDCRRLALQQKVLRI